MGEHRPSAPRGRRNLLGRATPFVAVVAAGALATLLAAGAVGMGWKDAGEIAVLAAGPALGAALVGGATLLALRRKAIGTQTMVVAITALAAVAAGAVAASKAMFLAPEDVHALVVVLFAAGTAGIVVSMALGRRLLRASRALRAATHDMAEGSLNLPERPSSAEFAALAEELETTARRLEEARASERSLDAARRELVAWVSHDLRTPLAGIRAMAEALEDGVVADPESVSRYHRMLRVEADRLAGLVDDLFELSRIQAGALQLRTEAVSLGDLISDALATASIAGEPRGVRVEGRMSGSVHPVAVAPAELSRAVRNLLDNAVRHTPGGGLVRVEAGIEGGTAHISVVDECGGIPEPDLGRVFDLAFRGEAARTPGEGRGAGLGLAIARGLIEAQGGTISVGNVGPGCRFVLRIPVQEAARLASPPSSGATGRRAPAPTPPR
jgi:signal transduction histidine kinase